MEMSSIYATGPVVVTAKPNGCPIWSKAKRTLLHVHALIPPSCPRVSELLREKIKPRYLFQSSTSPVIPESALERGGSSNQVGPFSLDGNQPGKDFASS